LLFHVDDFAAAAWCYKVPEELVRHKQHQHIANLRVHLDLLSSLLHGIYIEENGVLAAAERSEPGAGSNVR